MRWMSCLLLIVVVSQAHADEGWSAKRDEALLQGSWAVSWEIARQDAPKLLKDLAAGARLKVSKRAFAVGEEAEAVRFEIEASAEKSQQALKGKTYARGHLMRLVSASGKSFWVSYEVTRRGLGLRYPPGACTRSGTVIELKRVSLH